MIVIWSLAILTAGQLDAWQQSNETESPSDKPANNEISVELAETQIIIRNSQGIIHRVPIQELDRPNLLSIGNIHGTTLERTFETTHENNGQSTTIRGHAILIGPEGNQRVEIGNQKIEDLVQMQFLPNTGTGRAFRLQDAVPVGEFIIGIDCRKTDPTLKAQLGIEHGLVIETVKDASPAAEAGIQVHDILLSINGDNIQEIAQLIDYVQQAGNAEQEITIQIMRNGTGSDFVVLPTKRKPVTDAEWIFDMGTNMGTGRFTINRVLPGLIEKRVDMWKNSDELSSTVQNLTEQMDDLRKQIQQLREERRN